MSPNAPALAGNRTVRTLADFSKRAYHPLRQSSGGISPESANHKRHCQADLSAAAIMVSVPIVFLFVYISKYLVSGLTLGGVKG